MLPKKDFEYDDAYGMNPASGDQKKEEREGASHKKVEDDDAGPQKK